MHYVLIDHENVQPEDLAGLTGPEHCVWVFTGAQQKVAISLIEAVQSLGERGRFVRISGNGRNALDFHIAYYLGLLSAQDAQASFDVVARDGGYDPLIDHLKAKGIDARRVALPVKSAKSITKLVTKAVAPKKTAKQPAKRQAKAVSVIVDPPTTPTSAKKIAAAPTTKAPLDAPGVKADADKVASRLADMPRNLPGTEKSLRRMMGTWLSKDEKRLDATIAQLKQRGILAVDNKKLAYRLPKT